MNDQRKSEKVVYVLAILVIVIAVICSIVPLVTKSEIADKNILSTFGTEVKSYLKYTFFHYKTKYADNIMSLSEGNRDL